MLNIYRNACTSLVRAAKPNVVLTNVSQQQAKLVPAICDQSKYIYILSPCFPSVYY